MFCVNCGTQLAEGAAFCSVCGAPQLAPPPGAGPAIPPPPVIRLEKAAGGRWISEGWQIVTSDIPIFLVHALLFLLVSGAVPLILQGPMALGMQYSVLRKMTSGRTEVGDLFKGFHFFVPAMVAGILVSLFGSMGFALCIIPGFFVMAALQFPFLLILDKGMDFWPAIETSFNAAQKDWAGYVWFVVLQVLIMTAGGLACCVGILLALPVIHAATVVAYRDVFGFEPRTLQQTP